MFWPSETYIPNAQSHLLIALVYVCKKSYILDFRKNNCCRDVELDHIDRWAEYNNLRLNRAKSAEIIFIDSKRHTNYILPPPIPGISRVTTIKILGITITNQCPWVNMSATSLANARSPLQAYATDHLRCLFQTHSLICWLLLFMCAKNRTFLDSFIWYKQKCKVVLFNLGHPVLSFVI